MAMIQLRGYITPNRELQITLPDDIPEGEVDILLHVAEPTWTNSEIESLMAEILDTPKPKTGAEVIRMLEETDGWWSNITLDGQSWVKQRRTKEANQRNSIIQYGVKP